MNQTKEKILNASLELFSKRGFSSVSIRDICSVVQIKESTVYYHVQNKEAILDELLAEFQSKSEALIAKMYSDFPKLSSGMQEGEKLFLKIINEYVDNYLADSFCNKVIRILSIEQYNNPRVQKLYTYWLFEKPLEIQKFVFQVFNNAGIISNDDFEFAAEKFYSPIFFCASRYFFSGELSKKKIAEFKKSVFKHMEDFIN